MRRNVFMAIARFHHINRPMNGYYMEFGSHRANTIRQAWDCFRYLFDWQYICFDSFQGLPEITEIDRLQIWQPGKLATSEEEFREICSRHGIPETSLITVKGFYEESLKPETAARFPLKAAVIYVDCDLYRSTVPVLAFVRQFLQRGTVIVFDDWNCFHADPDRGERRAWREFLADNPSLRFEELLSNAEQRVFVFVGHNKDDSGHILQ